MAEEQFTRGFIAASADNTGNIYKAFVLSAQDTVTLVTAVSDIPVGIAQNAPRTDQRVACAVMGITKMYVGSGGVTQNDKLTVSAIAGMRTAGSGDTVYGHAHQTATSGTYFEGTFVGGLAAETITQG